MATIFGPGKLTITPPGGAAGTEVDISCLVNGARLSSSADQGDPTYKLCGDVRQASRKYTWTFAGNLDIDPEDPDGIFMLSQTDFGKECAYVFTPNNVTAVTATGKLILDPLDFGADDGDYGEAMTSDFEWVCDQPTYSATAPAVGVELADDQPELAAADA